MAETLHKSSGTGGLPKLLNAGRTLTFDIDITARSSLLLFAFIWAPYICMEKMLIISNDFSSETSGPGLLKFHVEPPRGRRTKDCQNGHGPLIKMAVMPIYGKNL